MSTPAIYMDNAATSFPKPESVYRAVELAMREAGGNPGRSAHTLALAADRLIFETREAVAELLGIRDSSNLIFTSSATESLNLAIRGLLKQGDHVVSSTVEHDAVVQPLNALSKSGVKITRVPCTGEGFIEPSSIMEALRPETALVALTHASNVIGTIQPVAEIGAELRKRGVPFLVDASQTAGCFPINLEEYCIDILAAPGHKGLLGPQGTGILYIAPHLSLAPLKRGGTGSEEETGDVTAGPPERYEAGTMNTPGIAGLGAGARFILEKRVETIRAHEEALIERLIEGLKRIDDVTLYGPKTSRERGALITFNIGDMDPAAVAYSLDDAYGIMTRAGLHCAPDAHRTLGTFPAGAVRLSPGWFTTEEEIERTIEAIKKIAEEGR